MRTAAVVLLIVVCTCWLVSTPLNSQSGDTAGTVAPQSRPEAPPTGPGSDIVRARCLSCHGSDLIVQQQLTRAGWDREIEKMIGWGAVVDESERGTLADYLTAHFGSIRRETIAPGHPGATLLKTRCLGCHDERLIEQQRLAAEGWTREVDKMIGWGAMVTDPEKERLVEYLASRWSP